MAQAFGGQTLPNTGVVIEAGKGTATINGIRTNLYELNYPIIKGGGDVVLHDGSFVSYVAGDTPTANGLVGAQIHNGTGTTNNPTTLAAAGTPASITVYSGKGTLKIEEFNSDGESTNSTELKLNKVTYPFTIGGQDSADTEAGNTVISVIGASWIYVDSLT